MAFKLKNLNIKKVDLVEEGANPKAKVNLFKSKEISVKKQSESFGDKMKERAKSDIYSQIWQFTEALSCSLIDILRDNDSKEKVSLMNKSLAEFYGAAGLAIEAWGNGKLTEYIVSDTEVSKETTNIMKSIISDIIKKEKEIKKGDEDDMKLEDLDTSKLSDEEKAQLKAIAEKAGIVEKNVKTEDEKGDKSKKDIQKEANKTTDEDVNKGVNKDTGGEDIYKGLHPAVAEELKSLRKSRDEAEMKELTSVAKKYEIIGKKPEELTPLLKSLKDAGGTAYNDMINVLDVAFETVEKSGIFKEIGSNGHATGESTTIAKAKAIADDIKKGNPSMSEEQAMAKAWETHPELMEEYDNEIGG